MTKESKPQWIWPGSRMMDRAWMRDAHSDIIHSGEALTLAMLLHVRKGRDRRSEEQLKDLLQVLPSDEPRKNTRGRRKPRRKP